MSRRTSECSRVRDYFEAFVRGSSRAGPPAERILPVELSAHVAVCLRCASLVSRGLVDPEHGDGERTANRFRSEDPNRAVPSRVRRFAAIVERSSESEFDELRDRVHRVAARRALRYVAGWEGSRLAMADCAAEELVEVALIVDRLRDMASRSNTDLARELVEFAGWIADVEHVAESFESLRRSGWLVPRPPALPCAGDGVERHRVVAWARMVLG